ncbi:Bystin-domain-containing protein [Rhizodiscina lignyota]|uniref:Bystin-domain-containing protein n=1 Tax=Rhizodiscina lignyota TaxID=1504668 RepID=A0A9P4IPT6_9PEZI|nr:Bystin-domain-containing protein [Rhizodiscina lignyota]
MPKAITSPEARQARRHNPLAEDYAPTQFKQKAPKRKRASREEKDDEQFVDSKASRKILQIGQDLADEDDKERQSQGTKSAHDAFAFESRFDDDVEEDGGDYDDEAWGDEDEEVVEEVEIDPQDLDLFNRFNPSFDDPILRPGERAPADGQGTNLADLILEKIAARETQIPVDAPEAAEEDVEEPAEIPPKVIEVYSKIALLLSRYKSGKLPKPFKILTTLPFPTIQTLIPITRPELWTANAVYAGTRLFISGTPSVAQYYINTVLLERVRDDIAETRKLNIHLYNALKKSLYKPAAFFKGFLFPLVGSGTCTLREAHIISSVLVKMKVPLLHSAAALHRLCEIAADQMSGDTEAAAAANTFIRVLLEKKYALPYKVVDALVFHFLRFRAVDISATGDGMDVDGARSGRDAQTQKLPVIWHQCLLAFAQRYRDDITEDQREALLDLLLVRGHKQIGPEVRRELLAGRGRGAAPPAEGLGDGGDDTMAIDAS